MNLPPELALLEEQLITAEQDAQALVAGLNESQGCWRASPGAWSVAQCLDHLARANRVYLDAMQPAAGYAGERGQGRRGPALPGILGRLFVYMLEPPVGRITKMSAPRSIRPRSTPALADALASFLRTQKETQAFLRAHASLDLGSIGFPNPFLPGIRFSLATGLNVIAAHERRHLWQAWQVRARLPEGI
ncbi:MAG: DinB family protein [Acidobacteria bacterium]|nr:DinB family protein [Acidobacteriota bacterium]